MSGTGMSTILIDTQPGQPPSNANGEERQNSKKKSRFSLSHESSHSDVRAIHKCRVGVAIGYHDLRLHFGLVYACRSEITKFGWRSFSSSLPSRPAGILFKWISNMRLLGTCLG